MLGVADPQRTRHACSASLMVVAYDCRRNHCLSALSGRAPSDRGGRKCAPCLSAPREKCIVDQWSHRSPLRGGRTPGACGIAGSLAVQPGQSGLEQCELCPDLDACCHAVTNLISLTLGCSRACLRRDAGRSSCGWPERRMARKLIEARPNRAQEGDAQQVHARSKSACSWVPSREANKLRRTPKKVAPRELRAAAVSPQRRHQAAQRAAFPGKGICKDFRKTWLLFTH